ncbi:LPD38 domain-containing protein [Comamonas piscis]
MLGDVVHDVHGHPIGQGFSTKGDAAKKRTGSNEKVTNILSHIVMQREAALTRGEKNNVAKRLYLLAAQNPDPSLWSLDLPKKKVLDPDTGLVRTDVDRSAVASKTGTAIAIRIGGKDKYLVFNERNERAARLALAVKNMDAAELDWLSRTMGHVTRWLAAVNTQYNPVFSVFNIVRDLQGASLQLSDTKLAGKQKDVLAHIAKNTGKIWAELRRERKEEGVGTGPWAQLMEQFQLDGGTTGFRELYSDPADRLNALQKELRKGTQGAAAKGTSFALGVLSDFNESLEMTTRLATYKVALDNGLSRQEAASLAKNITVNFNRKGRVTSVLGSHYAFLNAAIQGNARLLQTMTGPAGRKIALGGVGLGVMMALMGQLMMGGGDGADDEWKKIPEFVKERNIIIPLSRTQYVTIPMPLGFHVLPNLGRKMVDAAFHDDPTVSRAKYVGDMAAIALNAYNPFGGSDNMMQMFTPTWADPAIALATNKDWMGKSIFKEVRDINHPTPGHARVKDSTALPYRWAARGINAATGGSEWEQGAVSPTPETIQHLVEQAFGGVLREANKLGATATAAATGEELAPHQWFLAGRVYGNTTGMNGQSGTYYDNTKRINVALAEAKARVERGEDVDAVLKDVPLAKAAGVEKLADKRVSELTKLLRKVQAGDAPDKKDQVKAINKEIEGTMRLLNQAVSDVVKQPT